MDGRKALMDVERKALMDIESQLNYLNGIVNISKITLENK